MRILLVIFTCLSLSSFAQVSAGGSISEKMYFGGGFDFNIGRDRYGNRYTYISLSPLVGYRITPRTSVGATVMYTYYRYPDIPLSLHQYGLSPFVRHQITDQFFGYAELNVISTPTSAIGSARRTFTRGLLGGGYSQRIGESRGAINIMVLYDVLYKATDRAFSSPWVFRLFFTF